MALYKLPEEIPIDGRGFFEDEPDVIKVIFAQFFPAASQEFDED